MPYKIIGSGLCGAALAALLPGSTLYERNEVGGLCRDCDNYQDFVHVLHTDNDEVWRFVNMFTTVVPHTTYLGMYIDGSVLPYPPKEMSDDIFNKGYVGYSKKMWQRETPPEARARIITSPDGRVFHDKYEGIPDFATLFKNLTDGVKVIKKDVKDGDLDGNIILTGAIDEYFHYCFGELPYRGMKSIHYESETGLDADFITFPDEKVPYQRLVDYKRLGYDGQWIGVEIACNEKHYPIRDEDSEKIYNKYKELAESKGIKLCGRLATYHYQNMDEVLEQCINLVSSL